MDTKETTLVKGDDAEHLRLLTIIAANNKIHTDAIANNDPAAFQSIFDSKVVIILPNLKTLQGANAGTELFAFLKAGGLNSVILGTSDIIYDDTFIIETYPFTTTINGTALKVWKKTTSGDYVIVRLMFQSCF